MLLQQRVLGPGGLGLGRLALALDCAVLPLLPRARLRRPSADGTAAGACHEQHTRRARGWRVGRGRGGRLAAHDAAVEDLGGVARGQQRGVDAEREDEWVYNERMQMKSRRKSNRKRGGKKKDDGEQDDFKDENGEECPDPDVENDFFDEICIYS